MKMKVSKPAVFPKPVSIVLYGPPGVGKSSFAAQFPKPGFIIDRTEPGIKNLQAHGLVPKSIPILDEVSEWKDLLKAVSSASSDETIRTLVCDALTGFELLCFRHHCKRYFHDDWSSEGFFAYQKGPRNAATRDWPELLDCLTKVGNTKNLILIGHSQVKPYSNPLGPDYDRFIMSVDKETWVVTHRWAEAVFFLNYHMEITKEGTKHKASEAGRFLNPVWSPAYDAKNQLGLTLPIDMGDSAKEGYQNFVAAVRKARQNNKEG